MDSKKKNYYYKNNKNHYYKKKNKNEDSKKNTYDKLVNIRNDVEEISDSDIVTNDNYSVMKLVAISTIVVAIIFGSLLLFHLL